MNPVLLDNPNSRDDGVKRLLKAAQEVNNASVLAARKLQDGFELWGEPLASSPLIAKMQKACVAVRDEFSNYQAKYNTPAKSAFRTIRDSIADGTSGEAASLKVSEQLEKVKEKYISIYFEEHKKKRLDIDDAKRRGKLRESRALANLKKLRTIEILSGAKLTAIEQDMSELKVCYDLTPVELRTNPICPHCRYSIGD